MFHQAVYQFNSAVVADLKTFRQFADRRSFACRQSFNGEQNLVLLGLDSLSSCGCLAELEKEPDLMAKLGEGAVISR